MVPKHPFSSCWCTLRTSNPCLSFLSVRPWPPVSLAFCSLILISIQLWPLRRCCSQQSAFSCCSSCSSSFLSSPEPSLILCLDPPGKAVSWPRPRYCQTSSWASFYPQRTLLPESFATVRCLFCLPIILTEVSKYCPYRTFGFSKPWMGYLSFIRL